MKPTLSPLYLKAKELYLAGKYAGLKTLLPRLNEHEKRLMQARLCIRKGAFIQAQKHLQRALTGSTNELYSAEGQMLLATLHSRTGHHEAAVLANFQALQVFERVPYAQGAYSSNYNLSVDYNDLNLPLMTAHYLERAAVWARTTGDHIKIKRAKACLLSTQCRWTEVSVLILELENEAQTLSPYDKAVTWLVCVDLYARCGDFIACERALDKLKVCRKHSEPDRQRFYRAALVFLTGRSSNIQYDSRLEGEFKQQLELLSLLLAGERVRALKLWRELQASLPSASDHFALNSLSEQRSLFGRCLEKILRSSAQKPTPAPAMPPRFAQLHQKLAEGAPIRKEELIEVIWKTPYDPKYDDRFYKLLERFRKQYGFKVESLNRSYRLQ